MQPLTSGSHVNILCFQIEKLFDVACSLTDVLSLLPTSNDPFALGPRDHLHQFLTLIAALRNGDNRFLPLLLSKVHDVLPNLASPMLQTVPETKGDYGLNANIDIFDGFGNAGMGVPSSLPPHFDTKRIEEISSLPTPRNDSSQQERDNTPFTSPPIIRSPMEFPGMPEYNNYQDLNSGLTHGHGHPQGSMSGMPAMPQRQNSNTASYAVIPRSIPDFHGMGEMEHLAYR